MSARCLPTTPCTHVLLVEDNGSYARLTELTLEEDLGGAVRITHVPTLGDALAVLADAAAGIDVVVVDLGLPDVRGPEVVRRLRAAGAPPVIVLSGMESANVGDAVAAVGAVALVVKGSEHLRLAEAITAAVAAG